MGSIQEINVEIRDAVPGDLPAIQEIYAHHVLHGLASFEETPPDGRKCANVSRK